MKLFTLRALFFGKRQMQKISSKTYDKYIKALTDISGAITSEQYLEDILKLIVMVTAKVTGYEICSLWLIDESETPKKIRLKATQAIEPEYVKDRSLGRVEGVVGFVAAQSTPGHKRCFEGAQVQRKGDGEKTGASIHAQRAPPGQG